MRQDRRRATGAVVVVVDPGGTPGGDVPAGPAASGTAVTYVPTVIPISSPEIQSPTRGLFDWNYDKTNQSQMAQMPSMPPHDIYSRDIISWRTLEPSQGNYTLDQLDGLAALAKARGGRFGFRIMTQYTAGLMPDYIQNNTGTYGGFSSGQGYVPDPNNNNYLYRIEALWAAIGARFGNDLRFGMMDIGMYGQWGEWHLFGAPGGAQAITTASARRIIDAHVDNMPKCNFVMMYGNSSVSDAVAYAMGKVSSAGNYVGWRNDALGNASQGNAQTGSACWNGGANPQVNQWKRALVVGEIGNLNPNGTSYNGEAGTWGDALNQVSTYHYSLVGNGNLGSGSFGAFPAAQQTNWLMSGKRAGYRHELRAVTIPNVIESGSHATIRASWINTGLAPAYQTWHPTYLLKTAAGTIVWSRTSAKDFRFYLPGAATDDTLENFNMPANLPSGTMTLCVRVDDPSGYFPPLLLAITGRAADGSYPIGTVTVPVTAAAATVPGPPTGLVAVAGSTSAAVRFTAPASNGGAAISSYTVTASPGGATATGAGSPLTVTGLTNGTAYTFTAKATNSVGASAASAASAAVTPAPVVPGSFVISQAAAPPGGTDSVVDFRAAGKQLRPTQLGWCMLGEDFIVNNAGWKQALKDLGPLSWRVPIGWNAGMPCSAAGGFRGKDLRPHTRAIKDIGGFLVAVIGGADDGRTAHDNNFTLSDVTNIVAYYRNSTDSPDISIAVIGNEFTNGGGSSPGAGNNPAAPNDYQTLLAARCQAVKAADPTVLVSAPALPDMKYGQDSRDTALAAAGGYIDFVSAHAYQGASLGLGATSDYETTMLAYQAAAAAAGHPNIQPSMEEYNWQPVGTSPEIFDWHNTVFVASVIGHCLKAGANAYGFADSNGYLSLMNDGAHADMPGTPAAGSTAGTKYPAYHALGIWTGRTGSASAHRPAPTATAGHMVTATTTANLCEIFAMDNGKIVCINKDTAGHTITIGMGGVVAGTTAAIRQTVQANPFNDPVTVANIVYSGGKLTITIPAGTVTSIEL